MTARFLNQISHLSCLQDPKIKYFANRKVQTCLSTPMKYVISACVLCVYINEHVYGVRCMVRYQELLLLQTGSVIQILHRYLCREYMPSLICCAQISISAVVQWSVVSHQHVGQVSKHALNDGIFLCNTLCLYILYFSQKLPHFVQVIRNTF